MRGPGKVGGSRVNGRRELFRLRGNERMSDSLKKIWLKKSKILFFSMFYIRFFYLKNE